MTELERPPQVVVIDDDPLVTRLIGKVLRQDGLEVHETQDGKVGLLLCRQLLPDIILLDVVMPGMDGYAVCEGIRNGPQDLRQKPVVILTGLDDVDSIATAYRAGATDFITKPVNWAVLPHRIHYILRSSAVLSQLAISEATLARTQRMAKLVCWSLNSGSGELRCAAELHHLLGGQVEIPVRSLNDLFIFIVEEDRRQVWDAFQLACETGVSVNTVFRMRRGNGEEAIFHAQSDGGVTPSGLLSGTLQDITEQRRVEDRLSFLALHDELTGLPNRSLFRELTAHEIAQAKRHGCKAAGLFLSLEKFRRINEIYGYEAGDRLLSLVATRLVAAVRESDYVSGSLQEGVTKSRVARLAGGEFSVLLTEIRANDDVARVARRILGHFLKPFPLNGLELFVGTSIGITVYPDDCTDADSFMKHGDAAMHLAKEKGAGSIAFFDRTLSTEISRKLKIETELRHAVDNGELVLHYQPKVDAHSSRVCGVEALIRWRHPELGMVPPTQFIPVAEESGLIVPIGDWVLREACRQAMVWRSMGLTALSVAVNISACQFRLPDICENILRIVDELGMAHECLEIELTESMLVDDVTNAIRKMHELNESGIRLSIDDFGTGYSSLSYLMRFPLHALKVDKSFVSEVDTNTGRAAITTAIIAMAKSLQLQVIAEGVETAQEADWLRQRDCDILQGYYFSRPVAADAIAPLCAGPLVPATDR